MRWWKKMLYGVNNLELHMHAFQNNGSAALSWNARSLPKVHCEQNFQVVPTLILRNKHALVVRFLYFWHTYTIRTEGV